jgi:hypothetical protein
VAAEESRAISDRVQQISSVEELQRELDAAGDRLVILEVMADEVCDTGLIEPDNGWTPDRAEKEAAKLAVCEGIKHSFMRMAADSPSARFLEALVRSLLLLSQRRGALMHCPLRVLGLAAVAHGAAKEDA